MGRDKLGSRLGFILLSAGCAIGIGNVWKFPYVVGQNGGGLFVLIYLFFLVILGIPVLTMEFSIGRAAQKSPAKMYEQLEPKGSKWHLHGKVSLIGCYLLMMFYTTVAGWMLKFFVSTASGEIVGMDTAAVENHFNVDVLGDPVSLIAYKGIVVAIGVAVCLIGVQNGLEKVTKIMMLALLAIMVVLAVNSFTLPGGAEGLSFYLMPDLSVIEKVGITNILVSAMNQAFFTLSIGMGSMAIFGSYIGKDRSLLGESVNVALLDTFVAVASGLIIFPACSAYGVDVTSGPKLLFITLPNIFNNIPLGRLWGSLFFVFMSFAALSTVLAVFECIIANTMALCGLSRKKACIINGILLFLLSVPCCLGFNVLSGFQPLGAGSTILDLEDTAVSNFILPLGSFVFILFCVTKKGWGWDNFLAEANSGKGLKVRPWMKPIFRFVLPGLIAFIYNYGMASFNWR